MNELVEINGLEQSIVDESLADAGLPPALGVESYCVFRATRDATELSDGRGWTYHHHVDMAIWKGRLYVGWNSCEKDEDIWPARELYSTSIDGIQWSAPQELFPQGISTCLRVYFFLAQNGRMLVIGGLRGGTEKTNEDTKGALVVREIYADHSLGEVFTLQAPTGDVKHPPLFGNAPDAQFVAACNSLLADTVFLEQQDRGRLLGPRRMKWHDPANWPGGKVPGDNEKWVAGKAYTFITRPDGSILGLSKMGWVTLSNDNGKTWQQPYVPPTLVTGKAKVFAHQTGDGRFALVYNPSKRNRFPLAIVTGDDAVHYGNMRLVLGELPIQRYAGADRSVGPQYTRGVSKWADDGSRAGDRAMWLVYSMSKEDIWVSKVPVPVVADETRKAISGFGDWNIYQPKWTRISRDNDEMQLEDRDPYDYASATRLLPECDVVEIEFTVAQTAGSGRLEIDLVSKFRSKRAVQLYVAGKQLFYIRDGASAVAATLADSTFVRVALSINNRSRSFDVTVEGKPVVQGAPLQDSADSVQRIVFRTGAYRGIGGKKPVESGTDQPSPAVGFAISQFRAVGK